MHTMLVSVRTKKEAMMEPPLAEMLLWEKEVWQLP
jgi:hypothetical protein